MRTPSNPVGLLAALAVLATACGNDQGLSFRDLDSIAVTVGDFDNVQEPFNRLVLDTTRYDGIISTATWVEDEDDFDPPELDVEGLFFAERNRELREHGVVFVASGTRGFGEREYNSLQPDDQIVGDPIAVENANGFVRSGGVLWMTDWSYDLMPRAFPDKVDFLGDEEQLDAAQRGDIGRISARVTDDRLAEALGTDVLSLEYNFSNWAVIESVVDDPSVTVWLRGDVTYRDSSGEGTQTLPDAPLLVSVNEGGQNGEAVFSTFHIDAQNPAVIDTMLQTIVGNFDLEQEINVPGAE